jgi:hypothetical protein
MDEFRCYGGHELKPGVLWGSWSLVCSVL